MPPAEEVLALLRSQAGAIVLGTIFAFVGLSAGAVAAFARPTGTRILLWFGAVNAMYGLRMLSDAAAFNLLPQPLWPLRTYFNWTVSYFFVVPATLFWVELSRGILRGFLRTIAAAALLVGVAGMVRLLAGSPAGSLMVPNHLLAILLILVLAVVSVPPAFHRRYLETSTPVLTIGLLIVLAAGTSPSRALYSAAGHPPLLYWDSAHVEVRSIESNGLLLGVLKDTDYPTRELALAAGDRFVLYTDGLSEAENAQGDSFGDRRLAEVIRAHGGMAASQLSASLLDELGRWRSRSTTQQDDITWIVVDVL